MNAKVLKFSLRPKRPPLSKFEREQLIDALLDMAAQVERGEVRDLWGVFVREDHQTGDFGIIPEDPRRMLIALDRGKRDLIRRIEEGGFE